MPVDGQTAGDRHCRAAVAEVWFGPGTRAITSYSMSNLVISILANLITIGLVAFAVFLFGWLKRRRMLLHFFTGQTTLLPGSNRFLVYLSATERSGSPGGFVSILELTEARNLQELFVSLVPGPSGNPGLFRSFMVSGLEYEIAPVREGQK